MDYGLKNKVVLVAASSSGLGYATAKAFADEGARVVVNSRSAQRAEEAAQRILEQSHDAQVLPVGADLTSESDITNLFEQVGSHWGPVDVLVTNAGGPPQGSFDMVNEEQWEDAFQLTLMSVVRLVRKALPHMKEQRWGRILHFTSSSMKQPVDNLILSNAFRAGIAGLGKSLAIELAPYQILVNTIGPGRIATDRVASIDATNAKRLGTSVEETVARSLSNIPLGRYGKPEEFAALAVFLGSGANGYITGQSMLVDGGMVKGL